MRRLLAVAAALLLAPAAADADVLDAEAVLPPGQSGFVSAAGLLSGSGSPHLYDQTSAFTSFDWRAFTTGRPGATETPRAGVTIVRDEYGIPAVTGATENDAWWGVGYAVAQDRLFQLTAFRHATTGRLGELQGSSALDDDLVARRDFYTAAERADMLARIPQRLQDRSAAYRDGINAWVAHVRANPQDLPGEFGATLTNLEDWTLDDTAAVGIFLARTVPSSDGSELSNLEALKELGAKRFRGLLPLRVPGALATVPRSAGTFPSQPGRTRKQERAAFKRSRRFTAGLPLPDAAGATRRRAALAGQLGRGGSSMFAVRGKGRRAVLFNGPQLGFSVPELFVEFEVHHPGLDARGVSAAGIPVIASGHNDRVAWGVTSGLSDDDDLYAEELVPGEPEKYRFRGEVRTMDCRDETFRFKNVVTALIGGEAPESGERTERVCRTVHGPVQARVGGIAYARRYAIWGRELETFEGLDGVMHATSVKAVGRSLRKVTWTENLMAADDRGHIGFWHPGLFQRRPLGWDERLPYPGDGRAEWRGLLKRSRTPAVVDPKRGWLANWNNPPSAGWTQGDLEAREQGTGRLHRVGWLNRLVSGVRGRGVTLASAQDVIRSAGTVAQQRPLLSGALRRAARGSSGPARDVLRALLAWDGSYHRTAADGTVDPGVAVWERFKEEAQVELFGASPGPGTRSLLGRPGNSHAFDISNGEAYALRTLGRSGYRRAAARTHAALTARFGSADVAAWREPRRLYDVSSQGAGSLPGVLPFFDRGTFEHFTLLGPG